MTDDTPIRDPAQLGLDLLPGKRERAQPRLTWAAWSPEERLAREMDDTIGSYSTGQFVEVHA